MNNAVFGKKNIRKFEKENKSQTHKQWMYIQNMHQEPILYPVKCSMKIYLQLIE